MTEAYAAVQMPAEIGPNQCGSLKCKIDTSASGNVILCMFLPNSMYISTYGKPLGLHPSNTHLTAYNGSNTPEVGALDTAIDLKVVISQIDYTHNDM